MNQNKVILISIDGMRPDGFLQCGNPYIHELMNKAMYSLSVQTVYPSDTLPCHMSLFHSVPPTRHGITGNTYMPMARPLDGIFERLEKVGKVCSMHYNWDPMRDVARPRSVRFAEFVECYSMESSDTYIADRAIETIERQHPDFAYLYMVETDDKGGHDVGWMTETYFKYLSTAIDNVRKVIERFGDEYTVIITADHGGHDRSHGSDMPEDMTIPNFFIGKDFPNGVQFQGGSIMDIAPTITKLMGVTPAPEWEGKPVY